MGYVEDLRAVIGHRPIILVGAIVIMVDEVGRVLLQKRTEPYGAWGLPGGLMELGESAEQTARREVLEETGLTVGKLDLLGVFSGQGHYLKVSNGDEFYVVSIVYTSTEVTGVAKVNDGESLAVDYFYPEKLPEKLVGSHRQMLEKYKASQVGDRDKG